MHFNSASKTVARRLALACVLLSCSTAMASEADRPNVVMILSDDQAWTDYGFMGHESIETPHLDRLANESLTFTRGYVPSSLCSPSLASIITGLYPHQHGVVGNDPSRRLSNASEPASPSEYVNRRERLIASIDGVDTLPRLLRKRGYRSLQTGKWWLGNYRRGGFTAGMTRGFPEPGGRHGDDGLTIGREGIEPIANFIQSAVEDREPFFVWYAPLLPHTPHNPPERLLSKYIGKTNSSPVAKYWAMCEWFDETCGDVLQELDRAGISDNTIVVYVSDNGWINRRDRSAYAPRSKRSPYDGGLRTPLMIRWPARISPKRDEQTLVSSLDLAPTIFEACGIATDNALPGINLLDPEALGRREQLFGEVFAHDVINLDRSTASLLYRWTIDGRWKLILPDPTNQPDSAPELYDLIDDPSEQADQSAEQPELVKRLTADLDDWWTPE